jgi:hypothetical protein
MIKNRNAANEYRRLRQTDNRVPSMYSMPQRDPLPSDSELYEIAQSEDWLTPSAEVTRVALKPWQQTVFWGLRVYILVMLVVIVFGFIRSTSS